MGSNDLNISGHTDKSMEFRLAVNIMGGQLLPVVIGTNPERGDWLNDCIASVRATTKRRRVLIHDAGGFEIAALRTGVAHFRRFLFIQDSCEVLHPTFWDVIDSTETAWLFGGPPMYMAVYNRDDLKPAIADAPQTMDKQSSIVWEGELAKRLEYPTLWPDVTDTTGRIEEHHGRKNLVLENRYLRKFKGTWS